MNLIETLRIDSALQFSFVVSISYSLCVYTLEYSNNFNFIANCVFERECVSWPLYNEIYSYDVLRMVLSSILG